MILSGEKKGAEGLLRRIRFDPEMDGPPGTRLQKRLAVSVYTPAHRAISARPTRVFATTHTPALKGETRKLYTSPSPETTM